jgi:hypothetical protein
MTEPLAHVLHEAVAAIYFDDNSDFEGALWNIVRHLAPDLVGMLETNPKRAFDLTQERLASARSGECPICAGTRITFGKRCECAQQHRREP